MDYKTEDFGQVVKDYDAVFDTVGGEITDSSFKILKKGGILVSMAGQPSVELSKQFGVTGIGQNTRVNTKTLVRLTELAEKGAIKPQVDKVFPLEEAREAFEYFENGHPRGKVVVKIRD